MFRLLASLVFAVFAIALGVVPATADLARAPDLGNIALDTQATLATTVNSADGANSLVNIADSPVVLIASSASPSTNTAIAARSMPVIWEIAATTNDNTGDVSARKATTTVTNLVNTSPVEYAVGNYPNPFNATANIDAAAKTVTTTVTVTMIADDNSGALDRAGPSAQMLVLAAAGLTDNYISTLDVLVRAGPSLQAALGADTSLTALGDISPGVEAGVTTLVVAA
ncbi:MAG: hypothetical protein Q8L21_02035 [Candidatus Komeilibacteria bacterium]|nr:hypothetical protein [Candidatus Komeilibacteria bacterium]